MARVRAKTYVDYAWPRALGALYQRNGLTHRAGAGGRPGAVPRACRVAQPASSSARPLAGNFYAVFPARPSGRDVRRRVRVRVPRPRHRRDALLARPPGRSRQRACRCAKRPPAPSTCAYLDGGHGEAATTRTIAFTLRRRRFHHLTFYGFMLCFAATCVATLYHYVLGERAPYPLPACRCCSARSAASACSSARRACSG